MELCVFDTGIIKLRTFSLYPQINIYTKPDLKHSSLTHSFTLSRSQAKQPNQTNTYIQRNGTERNETKRNEINTHTNIPRLGPHVHTRTHTNTAHSAHARARTNRHRKRGARMDKQ